MRLLSTLLFSILAAFGIAFLEGEKTPASSSLALVTITPTTLALAGTAQPQALELGASIALAGLVIPLALYSDEIRLRLLLGIPIAGLLILSRTTGPWWAVAICLFALVAYPRNFLSMLFRSPSFWFFIVASAIFCAASLGWDFTTHDWYELNASQTKETTCGIVDCILPQGTEWVRFRDATAVAGWLNPSGSLRLVLLYWGFLTILFLAAFVNHPLKSVLIIGFTAAFYVLSVVLLSVSWADVYGDPIWQGRYALPLFIGLFVALSTSAASDHRLPRPYGNGFAVSAPRRKGS